MTWDDAELTAAHEAAHAIVALHLGWRISGLVLLSANAGRTFGPELPAKLGLPAFLAIQLAGMAAERMRLWPDEAPWFEWDWLAAESDGDIESSLARLQADGVTDPAGQNAALERAVKVAAGILLERRAEHRALAAQLLAKKRLDERGILAIVGPAVVATATPW